MIVVQHATEPRPAGDLVASPLPVRRDSLSLDQLSTEPLMKAFPLVVGDELFDHVPEMPLAEENQVIEALVFDGLDWTGRDEESSQDGAVNSRRSTRSLARLGHARNRSHWLRPREVVHSLEIEPELWCLAKGPT